jgi:hypothetical protein
MLICTDGRISIRAGGMPPVEANGVSYIKIPLNAL